MPMLASPFATVVSDEDVPLCLKFVSKSTKGRQFPGYGDIKAIVNKLTADDIKIVAGHQENDDTDWWEIEGEDPRLDMLFELGFPVVDIVVNRPTLEDEKDDLPRYIIYYFLYVYADITFCNSVEFLLLM